LGALEPVAGPERQAAGNAAASEFSAYLDELIVERSRRAAGDDDILGTLIHGEVDGEKLTHDELVQNCIFLLNAGHETTTNLIGNALYELLQWPDERRRLHADPDLIQTAVDEFLRFQSPNQLGNRRTAEAVEFYGETLPPGTRIHLAIGAANRDPRQFPEPDRLDLSRKPNKHLAFAGGPHLCVGFSLAKMEGRIAVSRFLGRFPEYRLNGEAKRTGRVRFRGFSTFPAKVG
jgi:cytochrome P450